MGPAPLNIDYPYKRVINNRRICVYTKKFYLKKKNCQFVIEIVRQQDNKKDLGISKQKKLEKQGLPIR